MSRVCFKKGRIYVKSHCDFHTTTLGLVSVSCSELSTHPEPTDNVLDRQRLDVSAIVLRLPYSHPFNQLGGHYPCKAVPLYASILLTACWNNLSLS